MKPVLKSIRSRILDETVTESDIHVLFAHTREKNCGPFIRDIGDLVVHPDKDRGPLFDAMVFHRAQVELLAHKIEGYRRSDIIYKDASCDWWLLPYMTVSLERRHKSVTKKLGLTRKQQKEIIRKQFEGQKGRYPTRVTGPVYQEFFDMLGQYSSVLESQGPFTEKQARVGIEKVLKFLKIRVTQETVNDLLACIFVCVHNSEFNLPNGDTARIQLTVNTESVDGEKESAPRPVGSPHGYLHLTSQSPMMTLDGRQGNIGLSFFVSSLRSEDYLDDDLIVAGEHSIQRFDLDCDIEFRPQHPRVSRIEGDQT